MLAQIIKFFSQFFSQTNVVGDHEKSSNAVPHSDEALELFLGYLKAEGATRSTLKNYSSDISQFVTTANKPHLHDLFDISQLELFFKEQESKGLKYSSIQRKFASIKQFAKWLSQQGFLDPQKVSDLPFFDTGGTPQVSPATQAKFFAFKGIKNFEAKMQAFSRVNGFSWITALQLFVLALFSSFLVLFGYKQFFSQALTSQAFPDTPTRPSRILSFQGRLTDTISNPITTATNLSFKLFNDENAGSELWASGTCSIDPDQDGIFNTLLGSTCGSELDASVFSENQEVWLEVTVGSETLTPRQRIATVAYALNAETLQGFPIDATVSATRSTVAVMNEWGEIVLGENSPKIKSVSGNFTIEGEAITFQTAPGSNDNIIFDADGVGGLISQDLFSAPAATLSANYAGGKPLVVRGGPSGTANLTEWQNAAGSVLASVDASGNLNLATGNAYYINGTSVLSETTLGSGVVNSSLTSVGALSSGSIVSGFGTISTTNTITGTVLNGTTGINTGAGAGTQRIDSSGNLTNIGTTQFNGITYTWPGADGTAGQVLSTNGSGTLSWTGAATDASIHWTLANGALFPKNSTVDFLIGGQATSSAKFAVLNVDSGTPTASVSAGATGAIYITAAGTIQTTNNQNLTIGGNTTGNIFLLPRNSAGRVGINTTSPNGAFDIKSTGLNSIPLTVTASDGSALINILEDPSGNGYLGINDAGGTYRAELYAVGNAGQLALRAGGLTTFISANSDTYFNGGNVGIGDTSPASLFTVGSGDLFEINSSGTITDVRGITNTGAITSTGGIVSLNASSNFATNINTGTSTGALSLGGGSGTVAINSTSWDISTAGVASGFTGITSSGTITFSGLSDGIVKSTSGVLSGGNLIDLTADVTGILPIANGGTNANSIGSAGSVAYSTGTAYAFSSVGTTGECLISGGTGTPTWGDCDNAALASKWNITNGTLTPINHTLDLLIGGGASDSAKFAVLNVNSGTPTASVSAGVAGATYVTANGTIQTTNNQMLTLGGTTTGNIFLNPRNGAGTVGIGVSPTTAKLTIKSNNTTTFPLQLLASDNSALFDVMEDVMGNGFVSVRDAAGTSQAEFYALAGGGNLILKDGGVTTTAIAGATDSYFTGGNVGIGDTTPAALLTVGNGDLFQVDASGNVIVATTIGVSGDTDLLSLATNALTVNGAGTFTGDLAVNGGDITSTGSLTLTPTSTLTLNSTGNLTLDSSADIILDADGADWIFSDGGATIATFTNSSTDLNLNIAGGQLVLANTNTINIGGTSNRAYNSISDSTAATFASSDNDLYVEDILEVGTALYVGGKQISSNALWQNTLNVYHPGYEYAGVADLAIGGTSTASAKLHINATTGEISGNGTAVIINDDIQIKGGDILGNSGSTRITVDDATSKTIVTGSLDVTSVFRSGSAFQFQVDASGNLTTSGSITTDVRFAGNASDTNSTPSFTWAGDTTTGMYRTGASAIAWSLGGTQRMTLSGTTFGLPGVTTLSATSLSTINAATNLTINSNLIVDSLTTANDNLAALTVGRQNNTTEGGHITLVGASTFPAWHLDSESGNLRFFTTDSSTTRQVQMLNTGTGVINLNVIGNILTSGTQRLSSAGALSNITTISASGNITTSARFYGAGDGVGSVTAPTYSFSGATNYGMYFTTTGATGIVFTTAGTESMRIVGSGLILKPNSADGAICNANNEGKLSYDADSMMEGELFVCHSYGGGFRWLKMTRTTGTNPDLAENTRVNDLSIDAGDLVGVSDEEITTEDIYYRFSAQKATKSNSAKGMLGVISTKPGLLLGEESPEVIGDQSTNPYLRPLTLTGRVPVKVVTQQKIEKGDRIGVSSYAGVGEVLTSAGHSVGSSLTTFDPATATCQNVNSLQDIVWSKNDDDFNNCYRLPSGEVARKIMVMVNNEYYYGDIALNDDGLILSNYAIQSQEDQQQTIFQLVEQSTQNIIQKVSTFSELLVANIQAGLVKSQQLNTNLIAPLDQQDLRVMIGNNMMPGSGKFVIENRNQQEVFSIDEQGTATISGNLNVNHDASISGQLTATSARLQQLESRLAEIDQLKVNTATISGQLYLADGRTIESMLADNANFLATQSAAPQEVPAGSYDNFLSQLTGANDATIADLLATLYQEENIELTSEDVVLNADGVFIHQYLGVRGLAQLETAQVSGLLTVGGNLLISNNSIATLSDTLEIQPTGNGTIRLLAGLMTLSDTGHVVINGDLTVTGTLAAGQLNTNTLQPDTFGEDLQIKLSTTSAVLGESVDSQVSFTNQDNETVASITAEGSGRFRQLITQGVILASDEDAANATAGKQTLEAGQTEMVINNNTITEDSLIYITPTSDTQNQVLFVKAKEACTNQTECQKNFTVGINAAITQAIEFNYWIVAVQP